MLAFFIDFVGGGAKKHARDKQSVEESANELELPGLVLGAGASTISTFRVRVPAGVGPHLFDTQALFTFGPNRFGSPITHA